MSALASFEPKPVPMVSDGATVVSATSVVSDAFAESMPDSVVAAHETNAKEIPTTVAATNMRRRIDIVTPQGLLWVRAHRRYPPPLVVKYQRLI